MSREIIANNELDKAEMRLKNSKNEILNISKSSSELGSYAIQLFEDTDFKKNIGGAFGIISGFIVDLTNHEDIKRAILNGSVDVVTGILFKTTPAGLVAGYFVGKALKNAVNDIYDWATNNISDKPEVTNGFVKVIMPNKTVYVRPVQDLALRKILKISSEPQGSISGGNKNDVYLVVMVMIHSMAAMEKIF